MTTNVIVFDSAAYAALLTHKLNQGKSKAVRAHRPAEASRHLKSRDWDFFLVDPDQGPSIPVAQVAKVCHLATDVGAKEQKREILVYSWLDETTIRRDFFSDADRSARITFYNKRHLPAPPIVAPVYSHILGGPAVLYTWRCFERGFSEPPFDPRGPAAYGGFEAFRFMEGGADLDAMSPAVKTIVLIQEFQSNVIFDGVIWYFGNLTELRTQRVGEIVQALRTVGAVAMAEMLSYCERLVQHRLSKGPADGERSLIEALDDDPIVRTINGFVRTINGSDGTTEWLVVDTLATAYINHHADEFTLPSQG